MKKILVIIGAVVVCVPLVGVFVLIASLLPASSVWIGAALVVGAVIWWKMRGRVPAAAGSETALMGRQTSKDGLL